MTTSHFVSTYHESTHTICHEDLDGSPQGGRQARLAALRHVLLPVSFPWTSGFLPIQWREPVLLTAVRAVRIETEILADSAPDTPPAPWVDEPTASPRTFVDQPAGEQFSVMLWGFPESDSTTGRGRFRGFPCFAAEEDARAAYERAVAEGIFTWPRGSSASIGRAMLVRVRVTPLFQVGKCDLWTRPLLSRSVDHSAPGSSTPEPEVS